MIMLVKINNNRNNNLYQRNLNFVELINSRTSVIPTVKVISPRNNDEMYSINRDSIFLKSSIQFTPRYVKY